MCWWGRLRRSWWLDGCVSSDEDLLVEENRASNPSAPANIPSQEESYYRKPLLRRADLSPEVMAPHPVLRLGPCLPELVTLSVRQLRRGPAHRRRARHKSVSSGQHYFTGGKALPETPTPASEPFAGGNGASPCPTVRTLLAGAGDFERSAAPTRTCSP